jgi:NADH:ubiquinone oxidoreductase subunit F (NADH-binding)
MRRFCTFVVTGFLMLCLTDANAQINPATLLSATSVAATNTNYYYARPNDLTIIVDVVGFVQRPGRYEIATSIDLINLISLAGGPTIDGALSKVSIIRLVGKGETITRRQSKIDLEDLSKVKQEDLQLTPGDLVLVDQTAWSTFRDVFPMVISAATAATIITQIFILKK